MTPKGTNPRRVLASQNTLHGGAHGLFGGYAPILSLTEFALANRSACAVSISASCCAVGGVGFRITSTAVLTADETAVFMRESCPSSRRSPPEVRCPFSRQRQPTFSIFLRHEE